MNSQILKLDASFPCPQMAFLLGTILAPLRIKVLVFSKMALFQIVREEPSWLFTFFQ